MKKNKNLFFILSLIILIYNFIFSFNIPFYYTQTSLYKKIISSRVLFHHLNPYTFKWNEYFPPTLYNAFNNLKAKYNNIFSTPTEIFLFFPLSRILNYSVIKIIWFVLEWLFFLLTLYFIYKSADKNKDLIISLNLIIFSNSAFWEQHLIKGEIYIFYVFIVALIYYLIKKSGLKYKFFISGFLSGFLISLFPLFIVFLILLFYLKEEKYNIGLFIGFFFGFFVIPSFFLSFNSWFSYFQAIKYHLSNYISEMFSDKLLIPNVPSYKDLIKFIPVTKIINPIDYSFAHFFSKCFFPVFISGFILLIIIIFVSIYKTKNLNITNLFFVMVFIFYIFGFILTFPVYSSFNVFLMLLMSFFIMEFDKNAKNKVD